MFLMRSNQRDIPEQETSIKERERALYHDHGQPETDRPPLKPFPVYLRETPAMPLSPGVKLLLWAVGIIVVILFVAALWRAQNPRARRPQPKLEETAAFLQAPRALYLQARPDGRIASN
jgi:hypothetical protein